jgi:hypothetical protein
MNDLERLEFHVGPKLHAHDGILDHLDYRRLRRLGVQLRDIPTPSEDWDIPPSSLQGWVESYAATIESVHIAHTSGLLALLKESSDEIQEILSVETLPVFDAQVVGQKTLEALVEHAKAEDRVKTFDFERFASAAPSQEEVARALVVQINVSTPYQERPKIDKGAGLKRLQVGALIGKAATGGALAVANLSLGALGGLSVVPAVSLTNIPIAAGLVTSAYTGLAAAFDAVEKIATALRD